MRLGVTTVSVTREIKLTMREDEGGGLEWFLTIEEALVTMSEETFQALIRERERLLRTARVTRSDKEIVGG